MTDSRKLTDNELEQVAGGNGGDTEELNFSVGDFVKSEIGIGALIAYKIEEIRTVSDSTGTKFTKEQGIVRVQTGQPLNLELMTTIERPTWIPEGY